jgi:hypothetical protein
MKKEMSPGFSLIESLISLFLFCVIFLACLSFSQTLQKQFFSLKQEFECNETAFFTLDRIKTDLANAGRGLLIPMSMGLLEGIKVEDNKITITSKEADIPFNSNLHSGQTSIELSDTKAVKKNRLICIHDHFQGEIKTIASIDDRTINLSSPLQNDYNQLDTTLMIVREVTIYPDPSQPVLRRKVNTSSAQPLAEDIKDFSCTYKAETHLAGIQLTLQLDEEKKYACVLSPKNLALAFQD